MNRTILGRRAPALALVGALLLCSCKASPPPTYASAVEEAEIAADEVLRAGGDAKALAIAIVDRDRVVWAGSFGLADAASGTAVTPETRFGIGSVSKVFAAAVVMQLVERGLVELDAPLVRYLPSFTMRDPRFAEITVRHLVNHASGLPGWVNIGANTSRPNHELATQTLAALANERLKADPGAWSVYCNDGFTLSELLVKAVTGLDYPAYVEANVFRPLGMTRSEFALDDFPPTSFARAYRAGVRQPQEFANGYATGGVYTTPADMARFARAFLGGGAVDGVRLLSTASVETMGVNQTSGTFNPEPDPGMAFGLGWDTVAEPALAAVGVLGWSKNGGIFHYGAQLLVAPREGLGVVVMGLNGSGYAPNTIAQRVMLRALAEKGAIAAVPGPVPPVPVPVASAPPGLIDGMIDPSSGVGMYASVMAVLRMSREPGGTDTIQIDSLQADGSFAPLLPGLRYRADGWFASDAAPLNALRAEAAGGRQYLAFRLPHDVKTWLAPSNGSQRVSGSGSLSRAWQRRVDEKAAWLLVNAPPDDLNLTTDSPELRITATPELPSLLVVWPSLSTHPQVVDPSLGDTLAGMMLAIPGNNSREMNDLEILDVGGEEWVRWGAQLHRSRATVPVLARGSTNAVVIGGEGYAEWRAVVMGANPATITIRSARAWRAYDGAFQPIGAGDATGTVTVPAGEGLGYLMVWGTPGASVEVDVAEQM